MRNHAKILRRLLLGTAASWAFAGRAGAWTIAPGEATTIGWPSGEGVALRLAPGALFAWDHKSLQLTHGMDVLAHGDAYHHWELAYGDGPNGAFFGTRYQNQSHVEQYEGGVTLGAPFANFGVGLIYDAAERKLRSVTLRGTFPLLILPFILFGQPEEK